MQDSTGRRHKSPGARSHRAPIAARTAHRGSSRIRPCAGVTPRSAQRSRMRSIIAAARHPGGDRPTARRCPGGRRSQGRAPSSERAYAADWRDFCAFAARIGRARACQPRRKRSRCTSRTSNGVAAGQRRSPASSRRSPSTAARWTHPTPTAHDVVRAVVRGTRRQLGEAQPQKRTALESTRCGASSLISRADPRSLTDTACR
jgi:hypothetical protein